MSIEMYPRDTTSNSVRIGSSSRGHISEGLITIPYMLIELLAIYLLGLAIAHYYVGGMLNQPNYYLTYVTPLLLAPLVLGFTFAKNGYYQAGNLQKPGRVALGLMKSSAGGFVLIILLGFLAGIASEYSRIWFVTWAFGTVAIVLIARTIFAHFLGSLSNFEIKTQTIAILGDRDAACRTAFLIEEEDANTQIVGIFDSEDEQFNLEQLIKLAHENMVDKVVVAKDVVSRENISQLLDSLSVLPCKIDINSDLFGEASTVSTGADKQMPGLIRLRNKPISELGLFAKSIADKCMALIGLIALSPLLAIVAIAIKLDSAGPVFFRQIRHGYNQREINVWKFRTMSVMENRDAFKQASKNDARVTKLGNLLRKSSIDELPQLLNVLAGDMSIVGPRPHPVALNDDFSKRLRGYNNRHKVKPGITGWAQINGHRGPTDQPGQMDKRIQYDLEYIENWSFWFDMKIILATPYYGLISKNAF